MINGRNCILEFGESGEFQLDPDGRKLLHQGQVVPLQPRTFDLLLVLLERPGQVVLKDEIMSRVWGDRIVEEGNLTQHIYHLRRFLRDFGDQQNLILTSSGGYLFNSAVREIEKKEKPAGPRSVEGSEGEARTLAAGRRVGPLRWASLTLLLIGLLGVSGLVLRFRAQSESNEKPRQSQSRLFVAMKGIERYPAWSPDGTWVAFTSNGGDHDSSVICVRPTGGGAPRYLTNNPRREIHPRWSPDGRALAFLRESEKSRHPYQLILKPVDGGAERKIGEVWSGVDWSPDERFLAVSDSSGPGMPTVIYLHSATGEERRAITPEVRGEGIFENGARFSPDGRTIAFVRWHQNQSGDLHLVDLDRREERRLTFDRKGITGLEWTPDGREILFISNRSGPYRLWRIDARGGSPRQIALDLDIESFSLSPDGRTILYSQMLVDSQIEIFSTTGRRKGGSGDWRSGASCLIDSSREDQSPRFSPDGKRVVFDSSQTGVAELWLANSDCTQLTQLTRFEQPGVVGSARWSPDGSRIVFDRHANGEVDLYSIDVNGGNLRRLTTSPTTDILPDWSPDGISIYFTSQRSGAWDIWKMAFPEGEAVQVTRNGGWESIVSADHRLLFFTRADTLWQKDLLSGEESIIPELAEIQVERNWTLTSQALFYIPRRFLGNSTLYRFDLLTRQIRQVHQIEGILARSLPSIAVAPDESRIAVSTFSYRLGDIWQLDEWR